MKTIIKLVSVLLVICVLAGMGACGKKTELPEKQLLENVYKTENFPMPENMQYINYLHKTENGYIVYGEVLDEENGYRNTFAKLDNEFKLVEYFDVDLGLEENVEGWFGEIVVADDGSIYTTISTNFYDEKTGYYESKNYLVHLDESFKVINRVLSTELLGLESGTYCYINNLTPLSGGRLAFFSDGMLYITDESNQIVFKATQEQLDTSYFSYLMNTPHGVVLLYDDQEYNTKAVILDTEALTFSESYDFSNLGYGQYYPGSGKYDI